jgi:Integrase zinc binding domain
VRFFTLAHFLRIASHPGGRRLCRIVAQHWWRPALARDAALFVKRCVSCQYSRAKRSATRTVPLCLFPPSGPMEFMSMDLLGPLPKTPLDNRHIIVMTDRFQSWWLPPQIFVRLQSLRHTLRLGCLLRTPCYYSDGQWIPIPVKVDGSCQ